MADSIQEALTALTTELDSVEKRAAALRQAIGALRALVIPPAELPTEQTTTRQRAGSFLGNTTMVKAAAIVLRHAGQPLHITELMARMTQAGFKPHNPETFRPSLVGSLDRGARDEGGWFWKPEPATYGLREWSNGSREANV